MSHARILLSIMLASAFGLAQSQPNSPSAALAINGINVAPYPMTIPLSAGSAFVITVTGGPLKLFAIALSVGDLAPVPIEIPGVGFLHIPLSPSPIIFADGFADPATFSTNLNGVRQIPGTVPQVGTPPAGVPLGMSACVQAVVQDPTAALGLTLTAATRATVTQGATITNLQLQSGEIALPVTMPTGLVLPFYNANYSTTYVCENGFMTFGSPDTDFTPTPPEFEGGPPRIAGFWTDLDQVTGIIRATADPNPPGLPPYLKIEYIGVIDWSGVGFVHNFSFVIENNGMVTLIYPPSNFMSIFETMCGITKGGNAWPAANAPAQAKDLSQLQNTGGHVGATSESIGEWFGQTTMPYYTYGVNRPYDLSGRTLTFLPNNGAATTIVGQTSKYYFY